MNDLIKNNNLIITNNSNKKEILKYMSSLNELVNVKVITPHELITNYYFDYDEKSVYYLMNKYNIKYSVARIYIENMYYVDDSSDIDKIKNLYNMKQELINNKLLKNNELFKDFINNKNIIVYNISHMPNIVKKILDNYEYKVIENDSKDYKHDIYEFSSLNDEVSYVASKCALLIKSGVDINKIFLTNLNDEYRLIIKRIFKFFNLGVYLDEKYSIYSTKTAQKFLNLYGSDIKNTIVSLKEIITKDEIDIYNKIINICNKYVWCDNYLSIKELIINDLKNTYIDLPVKENCIKEANIETKFNDDDYVFLLGFNQGVFPVIYKDEEYLSDYEKMSLNVETSIDKNEYEKQKVISILSNIKNLYITYKLKSLTDTFSISTINEELNYNVIKNNSDNYEISNLYNKIKLASYLDLFNKYGSVNSDMELLYSNYKDIDYRKYDNKFKGIDKDLLYRFLDNKLLLSYSSLDNYNRCNFRYYLNNILKVSPYEETFMQLIGNLFHYVLSNAFLKDFNYDDCFYGYIKDKKFTKKEEFFINKLHKELRFIIDTINEQNKHTKLDQELYEEKVYINLEGNIKVTFMGIVDKLKYKNIDDKCIVAIIDYKTGNPNLDLNNIIYGIEMQLPIYIYLAKNHPNFEKIEVAGFYLQKILNNEIVADSHHTYEQLKKKNLLLQGYSNDNIDILKCFDDTYTDSSVIKSLKTTQKGFYAYSKVINNDTINKLVNIVEDKIKESSDNILNAKFDINPKKIGYDNLGCEFCKFKDICYMSEKDIVNLKEYKNLEFLGGDDNA